MSSAVCPLCKCSSDDIIHRSVQLSNRPYYLCSTCSLVYVPREFHVSPEHEKQRYLQHNNSLENEGYVKMFTQAIETLLDNSSGISSILDYGCGYEPVLKVLLEQRGLHAQHYDPYFFPLLPDGPFDCVISTEAFEHFADVGLELERIFKRLGDGAYCAVMTRLISDKVDFPTWWYHKDDTHISFFSREVWNYVCERWSCDLIYCDDFGFTILKCKA